MTDSPAHIDPRKLKALTRLSPWRTVLALAADWTVIVLAIAIAKWSGSWLVYLSVILVIAGGMHGLGALMHEFAHFRFIANKRWSDAIGDLFVAWPLLATTAGYRRNHLDHHRYTSTDKDPDWIVKVGTRQFTFPQEMRFALLNFLGYFVGVSSVRDMRAALHRVQADNPADRGYKIARLSYYLCLTATFIAFGWWQEVLLYWLVPYSTLFFLFLYVRVVAEHFGPALTGEGELGKTRTVIPNFLEAWFLAPHGLNYHIEHHLYPSVPFYRLGELHRTLMQDEHFAARAHITRGYLTGLLGEIWLDGWRCKSAHAGRVIPAE